jgi:hypothetical protein
MKETCDSRGSPRIFKAAYMLCTTSNLSLSDAMKLAGYKKKEIAIRRIRQAISKKKSRLVVKNGGTNNPPPQPSVSFSNRSTKTKLSDLTSSTANTNSTNGTATMSKEGTKKTAISGRKSVKPRKKAFAKVMLAKNSRRTPNQVRAATIERNDGVKILQSAIKWAVSEAKNYKNKAELARVASEKFGVNVVAQTLRKLLREGRDQLNPTGPKPWMCDEHFNNISAAMCSYVAIGQINGYSEKKKSDLVSCLEELQKTNKIYESGRHFNKIKVANAALLALSKEEVIELRRQIWTTHTNLNDWFDSWEVFLVSQGFATEITGEDGNEKEVIVSEDQKRRIINVDETNLSLDGSDGGRGGRPGCTITIKHCSRPGTAQNQSSVSSSLMCGSNAAGEAMPMHIMFSSDAKEEANFAVNASWIIDLPRVTGQFGHDEPKTFPSSVMTNEKGGTDARVLQQVLLHYIKMLYPDADDIPGK